VPSIPKGIAPLAGDNSIFTMTVIPLGTFLSSVDAGRVGRTLAKLDACGPVDWMLTGGLAVEAHLWRADGGRRLLNDIDLVVPDFVSLPHALGDRFLVRHAHPKAGAGKLLIQIVDPEEALRIDIFSVCGEMFSRSWPLRFGAFSMRLVAAEDLTARLGVLTTPLARGETVLAKYADDFERLVRATDADRVETIWRDHRRSRDPLTFAGAKACVDEALHTARHLLIEPEYSRDPAVICQRCDERHPFRLADAEAVLRLLGYC
jgi:hypothetical protein